MCKKYDLTRSKKWIHLAIDLIWQRATVFRFETEEIESIYAGREQIIHTVNTTDENKKVEDREKNYER